MGNISTNRDLYSKQSDVKKKILTGPFVSRANIGSPKEKFERGHSM